MPVGDNEKHITTKAKLTINTKYSIPPAMLHSKYCSAEKNFKKTQKTIEKSRKILDAACALCYSMSYLSTDGFIFVRFFSDAQGKTR